MKPEDAASEMAPNGGSVHGVTFTFGVVTVCRVKASVVSPLRLSKVLIVENVVEAVSMELTPPIVIVPPFAADIPCANKFGLLIVRLLKVVVSPTAARSVMRMPAVVPPVTDISSNVKAPLPPVISMPFCPVLASDAPLTETVASTFCRRMPSPVSVNGVAVGPLNVILPRPASSLDPVAKSR